MFRHSIMKQSHLARKFDHMHKALVVLWIISYHIISYHIISYHIISYHIISYRIISYHIILYYIISYHIISCAVKLTECKTRYILYFPIRLLFGLTTYYPVNVSSQTSLSNEWTTMQYSLEHTALETMSLNAVPARSITETLPHLYRHWQYHKTEHCHIGTGTHSITQQSTATLVQILTVSHNSSLPQWYRHWQYHTTEHCHIGTDTHSITQESTATLGQALTVSHNRALPHW